MDWETERHTREERLLQTLAHTGLGFYVLVAALLAVLGWGAYAYLTQLRKGLVVTGMRDYVSWGLYITNFVFFIGISHAGTLISAILRVTGADWRRPITRMAEAITVFALLVGAPMVVIDMGRPDRILHVLRYGRIQSPILWDVIAVTTYLTGSLLYLYIPMIPDLALLRDRFTGWRGWLYRILSLGWRGSPQQRERLERGVAIMAVLIIPIAVSVHTVVSWLFGMTVKPGWHSTIFGPYFVVGAIFSGIASILVAMALFRRAFHLEDYITPRHFRNLGLLLLAMDLIYIYFTLGEYLTGFYGGMHSEAAVLASVFTGRFALMFWSTVILGFFLPAFMLAVPPLLPERRPERAPRPLSRMLRPALATSVLVVTVLVASGRPGMAATLFDMNVVWTRLGWVLLAAVPVLFVLVLPELKAHPVATTVGAAVLVNVAMWAKRYIIVVPTLENPFIPIPQYTPTEWAHYTPTWVEWAITAGAFAAFALLYMLFAKVFPIVSIWETREEQGSGGAEGQTSGGAGEHGGRGEGWRQNPSPHPSHAPLHASTLAQSPQHPSTPAPMHKVEVVS
ncbi:MAG: NrfD/PsrC family molybdoenzyme membrane anchor subunit [Anaerolineae bacterium]